MCTPDMNVRSSASTSLTAVELVNDVKQDARGFSRGSRAPTRSLMVEKALRLCDELFPDLVWPGADSMQLMLERRTALE